MMNATSVIKKIIIAKTANFLIKKEKTAPQNNTRTTHSNVC